MSTKKAAYKPGQSAKKASSGASRTAASTSEASSGSVRAQSLAQQIAQLANPTPKDFDPEDIDTGGVASALVTQKYDEFSDDDAPKLLSERTTLRKNFDVDDVTAEYSGKVVSRKALQAFSDDEEDEEEEDGEMEDGEEELEDGEEEDDEEEMDMEDDEEMEDGEEEDDEEGSDADHDNTAAMLADGLSDQQRRVQEQLAALEEEDEQAGASLFQPLGASSGPVSSVSAVSQYTKSVHMKNQLQWYTHMLNLRIRFQGLLTSANKLPPPLEKVDGNESDDTVDLRSKFEQQSSAVSPAYSLAMAGARRLMDELFELQHGLMKQNKKIFAAEQEEGEEVGESAIPRWQGISGQKRKREEEEEEDEETLALSEDEPADETVLSSYWSYLSTQLTPYFTPLQNALIDKWNTKTQLSAGVTGGSTTAFGSSGLAGRGGKGAAAASGLKVINQSILAQIEQLMVDEERLIKRSQLNRAAGHGTGQEGKLLGRLAAEREKRAKEQEKAKQGKAITDDDLLDPSLLSGRYAEEYDSHIYDDNDYYQQLLAEIISAGSGAGSDGSSLAHDADLVGKAAAARKKSKKSGALVDRRASKGRKLRYTVHAKLANFMAPKPAPISEDYANGNANSMLAGTDFAMDELFMNLFGGQGKQVEA